MCWFLDEGVGRDGEAEGLLGWFLRGLWSVIGFREEQLAL